VTWNRISRGVSVVRLRLKCDGTRADTRFRLSPKWTSPFKSAGLQFSRLLAADVCASAVVMLDTPCSEVVWRVLATHSIRQFPLHSPPVGHRVPSHFNWTLLIASTLSSRLEITALARNLIVVDRQVHALSCALMVLPQQISLSFHYGILSRNSRTPLIHIN
jgi:hypothetical protein